MTSTRSVQASRWRSAASRSTARPGCTAIPTGTSRSMPICDALLGASGAGDLGRLLPGRAVDACRDRELGARRRCPAPPDRGRVAPVADVDLTIVAARPRLAGTLDDDAGRDRRAARAGRRRRSTSRRRPATSPATRAQVDRCPRWRSRRSRRPDERSPPRHADRRDPALRAARRRRRHLLVRSDGLRTGPRRQLPIVPVRRPAGPSPALAWPHGPLGHEHHRRRRQDHPGRGGGGRRHREHWRSSTWPAFLADMAVAAHDDRPTSCRGRPSTSTRWPT